MPAKLEQCVKKVIAQGKPEDSAWPICVDSTGLKPHKKSMGKILAEPEEQMVEIFETGDKKKKKKKSLQAPMSDVAGMAVADQVSFVKSEVAAYHTKSPGVNLEEHMRAQKDEEAESMLTLLDVRLDDMEEMGVREFPIETEHGIYRANFYKKEPNLYPELGFVFQFFY